MATSENLPNQSNGSGKPGGSPVSQTDPPYYVVLPCDVKDFRQFVSGLLGKPQELRGELEGTFNIGYAEISTIFHLLEQRMSKQNDASLVHFGITVYYDNGESVVHNSVSAFESYHPTSACVPVAVTLTATYLIKFRGHDTPEKQEIEVTFATTPEYNYKGVGPHRWFDGGMFEYRILHTERTWATDIAGLLRNHAATVVTRLTGLRQIVHRRSDELTTLFVLIVFAASVLVWSGTATSHIGSLNFSDSGQLKEFGGFLVRSVAAFSLLATALAAVRLYVEVSAYLPLISTIAFTERDKEKRRELERKSNYGWVRYGAAWLVSIACGVLSNVIYSKSWFW